MIVGRKSAEYRRCIRLSVFVTVSLPLLSLPRCCLNVLEPLGAHQVNAGMMRLAHARRRRRRRRNEVVSGYQQALRRSGRTAGKRIYELTQHEGRMQENAVNAIHNGVFWLSKREWPVNESLNGRDLTVVTGADKNRRGPNEMTGQSVKSSGPRHSPANALLSWPALLQARLTACLVLIGRTKECREERRKGRNDGGQSAEASEWNWHRGSKDLRREMREASRVGSGYQAMQATGCNFKVVAQNKWTGPILIQQSRGAHT
jgi:hypothetical protein